MTDSTSSSMTYLAASSLSARSLGEENMVHAPEKTFERFQAPSVRMRVFRQIFCLTSLILFMALLRDLRSEIEKRSLPSGGWASGQSRRAGIETTCYGLIALAGDRTPVRERAINALLRTKNSDGSWPAFEGDDPEGCWLTSLALITLRALDADSLPAEKATQWLL